MRHVFGRSLVRFATVCAVASVLLPATVLGVRGQSLFEKLILPGDVVTPHAKHEKTCESCHEPFSKTSQRRLCLECHKEIAADVTGKTGFHGKRPEIAASECKTCHTDHKGRDADIVQMDEATFNHLFSDFQLNGAHKTAPCAGCHAPEKPYRKAASGCIDCHKSNDPHQGNLGENCSSCHNEDDWRKQKTFDHSKTKFPLDGAHGKVACAACHAGEKYKGVPQVCAECHKIQDVHAGRFGVKCESCHASSKWTTIRFDHAKATKFPLNGAHSKAACAACHKGDLYKDKLTATCIACHKSQDPHKGELGTQCASCHNETSWQQKVAFDHDVTRFPLIGLHAAQPCEACHQTAAYRDTSRNCSSCHKDTEHKGALGSQCGRCHNPNGWQLWRFNHDRDTKFPLTGAHAGLNCSGCHTARADGKVSAPKDCFSCHSEDDAHRGSFGRACEKCHSTSSFRDGLGGR